MKRCLIVLAIVAMASTASAQTPDEREALLAPLPVRDQFLLSNGFFFFTPESMRALPEATWSVSLSSADSNTFAKSEWISHSLEGRTTREQALAVLSDPRFQS